MKLPRGVSYKAGSIKNLSLAMLLSELRLEKFSGYVRLTVEIEKNLEDGYLVLSHGEITAAGYEGIEKLRGKLAHEKIKAAALLPGIFDVYKFSDFQLQITLEENKECLLSAEDTPRLKEEIKEEAREEIKEKAEEIKAPPKSKIPKPEETVKEELREVIEEIKKPAKKEPETESEVPVPKQPKKVEAPVSPEESEEETEKRLKNDRLKILKRYGLSEPTEEYVDAVVSKFYMPADYEIATKAKELKKEMIKNIRALKDIESVDIYVSTTKGEDIVEFGIDVYVKPLTEKIKKEIEKLIDETLKERVEFPCEKEITITAA